MSAIDTPSTPSATQTVPRAAPAVVRPVQVQPASPAVVRPSVASPAVARPSVPSVATRPQATTTPQARPAPPAPTAKPEHTWAKFFRNWPKNIPTRGVVNNRLNDTTVFKSFMLQGELILLERISPDSVGARFVVLPFEEIASVKYTDQLRQDALESAGFVGNLAK